jgi:uncharacterized membrane protein
VWSGVLLGLGAAAKLYPALLVVPFVAGRMRGREPDRGIHLAWAAAGLAGFWNRTAGRLGLGCGQ